MTAHHASDATLSAYAAGSLPEALGLIVATHLSFCPACRDTVRMVETAGGQALDEIAPVAMAPDALAHVTLRATAEASVVHKMDSPPPVRHAGLPPPLDRCDLGRWWPIAPGLRFRPLRARGAAWGGLLAVAPGRSLPRHGHDGMELACILRGSYVDEGGRYQAGDLSEPEFDHDRPPRVDSTEPCVCVIASEGVRLHGLLGVVQRALGR